MAKDGGQWLLPMAHFPSSAAVAMPMELCKVQTPDGEVSYFRPKWTMDSIYEFYHAVVDETEWEAQPIQWLSVYSQAAQRGEGLVRSLEDGMVGRAVACGKK